MYKINPLLEFSPADLVTSVKAAKPVFQQIGLSGKRMLTGTKSALKSKKPVDSIARMITHNAAKDKTLIGKGLRAGNAGLDAAKITAVAATPPMPSPDMRNMKHIIQNIGAAKGSDTSRLANATRLGRTIKHPIKTARRFADRTVTGAITDMPMLSIPGIYNGPNPMYGVANGTNASDIYRMGKHAVGYNWHRLKSLFGR